MNNMCYQNIIMDNVYKYSNICLQNIQICCLHFVEIYTSFVKYMYYCAKLFSFRWLKLSIIDNMKQM